MKTNPNDLAFESFTSDKVTKLSMSKREYFAAKAMQGLAFSEYDKGLHDRPDLIAKNAVRFADALIAELNKKT